ncbi:MAG: hypothetical protein AABW68_01415 [archaeon]
MSNNYTIQARRRNFIGRIPSKKENMGSITTPRQRSVMIASRGKTEGRRSRAIAKEGKTPSWNEQWAIENIQRIENEINEAINTRGRKRRGTPFRVQLLETQKYLLELGIQFHEQQSRTANIQTPTGYQALAAAAWENGLSSPILLKTATCMQTLPRNTPQIRFWKGDVTTAYKALSKKIQGKSLPDFIEELFHQKNKPLDNEQLLEAAQMPLTRENRAIMNGAMMLLENMRLVKRYPEKIGKNGHPITVWVRRGGPLPTVDYANTAMELLMAAFSKREGVFFADIFKKRSGNYPSGNPDGRFSDVGLHKVAKVLQERGVLLIEKVRRPLINNRNPTTHSTRIKLTPKGIQLMRQYARRTIINEENRHVFPEELRKIIVE